jgi:hypothetical protein
MTALAGWMDSWPGLGAGVVGMAAQGSDLQLTEYTGANWRATFFVTGMAHSIVKARHTSRRRGGPCSGRRGRRSAKPEHNRSAEGDSTRVGFLTGGSLRIYFWRRRFHHAAMPAAPAPAPTRTIVAGSGTETPSKAHARKGVVISSTSAAKTNRPRYAM